MPIYAQFSGKTVMVTIAMARKKMVNQVKKSQGGQRTTRPTWLGQILNSSP
jgi:hypothetical protein